MTKILNTLQGRNIGSPPIWLMRQAGRYLPEYLTIRKTAGSFMDLCFNPTLAAEVTLQPIRRFGFDASIIFSDILTIPHVLGQTVSFESGIGPLLINVNWPDFLSKAQKKDVRDELQPVHRAIERVRQELSKETTLIGFAGSPWTVATYMVSGGKTKDFSQIVTWAETKSPLLELISILTQKTIDHLSEQISAGAEVIQLFDTWASAVPAAHHQKLILDPLFKIIREIQQQHPTIPIIYFAKGLAEIYPLIQRKFDRVAFSVDHHVSASTIRNLQDSKAVLQGNVSPEALVEGGETLDFDIDRVLSTFENFPFIVNLGHGILPQTPIEHVHHLINRIRHG